MANTEDAYGFPPFAIMERAITLRPKNLRKGKKRDIKRCERWSGNPRRFLGQYAGDPADVAELRLGRHHSRAGPQRHER